MDYIGVDLGCSAGGNSASSAVAVLGPEGRLSGEPRQFHQVTELLEVVSPLDPQGIILAVDAPRSVPDHAQENYSYRSCEQEIKKIDSGAGAFAGVAALYVRWYEIETRYLTEVKVIETYPRVIWKHLGLPGKPKEYRQNRQKVWQKIEKLTGIPCNGFSHHQFDAVLCAYTAYCYDKGEIKWFGRPGEGLIIIPSPGSSDKLSAEDEIIREPFRCFSSMQRDDQRKLLG